MMKTLKDLVNLKDSGWQLVKEWMKEAQNSFEVLERNPKRADEELISLQVTTRSPMGAIIYETGGILIDKGWLRILGSGSPKLNRGLVEWNQGKTFVNEIEKGGFLLIADDILGGYFAINAGELGDEIGNVYYFAPDTLAWESLECSYSNFIYWTLNGDIQEFYKAYKWKNYESEIQSLTGNQVFSFYPYLWSTEGQNINKTSRKIVPIEENYHFNTTFIKDI